MKAVIVDTNAAHRLFNGDNVGAEIWALIKTRSVQCPCGGTKYAQEIIRSPLSSLFQELTRRGSLRLYDNAEIDEREKKLENDGILSSDDAHILALAARSGCRVLFSNDQALSKDFKNLKLLPSPKGKILNKKFHKHVLANAPVCHI